MCVRETEWETDEEFEVATLLKPLTGPDSESCAEESGTELRFEKLADGSTALCCASFEQTACGSCKGAQAGTADEPVPDVCVQSASSKSYGTRIQYVGTLIKPSKHFSGYDTSIMDIS